MLPSCPRYLLSIAICGLLAGTAPAYAAPFRPTDDAQVLERLPTRLLNSEQQSLRRLRDQLRTTPDNATVAAELAEHYYRLSQRTGDPRYIGYAQSVLAPWPPGSDAPAAIRTVRALVAQFLHDFAGALRDLDAVLRADPGDVGARSYRAIIHLVKADYDRASADCIELERRIKGLVASACLPTVAAVNGQAPAALIRLAGLLARYPAAPNNEKLWVFNRLAEIAQRLGQPQEAEAYYRQALGLGITDQYLLATYAEFLLDQQRPAEAVELLQAHVQNDVLLLRLALAEKALDRPAAATHRGTLADRYAASRQRGDKLHLADEAMFALHFAGQPATALKLAQENWDLLQREPSDARILIEAALAARDAAGAKAALDWLRSTGHEDVTIRQLAARLEALRGGRQ
jgi:tetratricopeptide (TPR) repeat protein